MADGQGELPEMSIDFRLADLQVGQLDPRKRMVLDVFWAVQDFKIYKTAQGLSPFFSDDPKLAKEQRTRYLAMGERIARFNHLISTMQPTGFGGQSKGFLTTPASHRALVQFERGLARCIAQALSGDVKEANAALDALQQRLGEMVANRGRIIHLAINVVLVGIAVTLGILAAKWGYTSVFGFEENELALAIMMGAAGALFSTTVRLRSMEVDATVGMVMHSIYAFQRVLVGVLGAVILYFGIRAGLLTGLVGPLSVETGESVFGPVAPMAPLDIYWLSFMCVLAGFSERFVPNLLDGHAKKAAQVDEVDGGQGANP